LRNLTPQKRPFLLRITLPIALPVFLYLFLPVYLKLSKPGMPAWYLFLFYLVNAVISIFIFRAFLHKSYEERYRKEQMEERINVLRDQVSSESKNNASLKTKIMRYQQLKNIVGDINKTLELNSVAESLVSVCFSLIGNNKGVCALYLVDEQTSRLLLYKTKKEDREMVIKAKEGDIFDLWVLRHAQPLLIENIRKDFRFDLEKIKKEEVRPFSSLISSCFLSDHKFLGILRLDNPVPQSYSQDDLRFLVKICELGSVALENSELFKKTQDLAVHDSLTSLFTKGYLLERLKEELNRALRKEARLSILMIDIDFFKKYNDKFGHIAGDIVLQKLSSIISEYLKDLKPIICRFGGEEFCAVLSNIDKKRALDISKGLCDRIAQEKLILRRQETQTTVSIGVATFPVDAADETEIIQKADKAMYAAKARGRNQACCA